MLIVAASMEQELIGLRREMLEIEDATGVHPPVEFRVLGVGPDRAGSAMAALAKDLKSDSDNVLVLGVAGGVNPDLDTGDILLADRYSLENGASLGAGKAIRPDPQMMKSAEQAALDMTVPVCTGGALTVDHLVVDPFERVELRAKYQADSVNMEDYRVAEAAQNAGVPFLSVRVVLDTAEQRLPGYLPGLAKSPYKVLTHVLLMPWRIPTMLKLKRQLQLCQAVLTNFAVAYMEATGVISPSDGLRQRA
ncbi:MAG: hypothetical protein CL732_08915 [Chloroflexi bacterium]|nr:hypothetical protein [Chloroflexota bacterium]